MNIEDPPYHFNRECDEILAKAPVWAFSSSDIRPVLLRITKAIETVLTIQARHRLGSIKLLSQTIDPLYRPGEYQECVLDSISKAGTEYNDPSFEPLVASLRFLRSIFELRLGHVWKLISSEPALSALFVIDEGDIASTELDFYQFNPFASSSPQSPTNSPSPNIEHRRISSRRAGRSDILELPLNVNAIRLFQYCRICRYLYQTHVEDVMKRIQKLVDEDLQVARYAKEILRKDKNDDPEKLAYQNFPLREEWIGVIEGRDVESLSLLGDNNWKFPYKTISKKKLARAITSFKEERITSEVVQVFENALKEGSTLIRSFLFQAHLIGKGPFERNMEIATEHFKYMVQKLRIGDPEAQYVFGYYCWYGGFLREDRNLSVMWYTRSAIQGFPGAIRNIALYFQAHGCVSGKVILQLFEAARARGDSRASFNIANTYFMGDKDVEIDYVAAREAYYSDVMYSGRKCSIRRLGEIYYFGRSVEVDLQESKKWFLKAAENGDVYSYAYLGDLYYYENGLGQDIEEAKAWYQKAADKGNYYGYLGLGRIAYKLENYLEAKKWFEKASALGRQENDPEAWYMLGLLHSVRLPTKKIPLARAYYERAAFEGMHTEAYYMLAELYNQEGYDRHEYLKWCEMASEKGHCYSQFILAAYSLGDYHYSKRSKVLEYYEKSGAAGTGMAYTHIGHLYYEGFIVTDTQNVRKAIEFYHKATVAAIPDPEAKTWAQFVMYKSGERGGRGGYFWNPTVHHLYPRKFQRAVMALLMIHKRKDSYLSRLPLELLYMIISWLPIDIPERLPSFPSIMGVIKAHYKSLELDVDEMVVWAHEQRGSPVLWGCEHNNVDIVLRALERGYTADVMDEAGNSPLHLASSLGNKDLVQVLLALGNQSATTNNDGETPFARALKGSHDQVAKLLIEYDILASSDLNQAFAWGSSVGGRDVIWKLLEYGKKTLTDSVKLSQIPGNICNDILVEPSHIHPERLFENSPESPKVPFLDHDSMNLSFLLSPTTTAKRRDTDGIVVSPGIAESFQKRKSSSVLDYVSPSHSPGYGRAASANNAPDRRLRKTSRLIGYHSTQAQPNQPYISQTPKQMKASKSLKQSS